jgi:geranylgeranyl diphosphate synthase type I
VAAFGQSLGMGFQIRDDLLGVWGKPDETGKPEADDIRRHKKSLPILLLRDRLSDADWERVTDIYRRPELTAADVREVLELLDRYAIAPLVQAEVQRWHDDAIAHLTAAIPDPSARADLEALTHALVERTG